MVKPKGKVNNMGERVYSGDSLDLIWRALKTWSKVKIVIKSVKKYWQNTKILFQQNWLIVRDKSVKNLVDLIDLFN